MAKRSKYQETLNLPQTSFPMRANLREMDARIFADQVMGLRRHFG